MEFIHFVCEALLFVGFLLGAQALIAVGFFLLTERRD